MKFLSLFIGAVSATTLAPRDLALVQGVLNEAASQVTVLNGAVNGFSGDPAPLIAASNQLIQILSQGTARVASSSDLSQDEALQLATSVTTLNGTVAGAVDNIISKSAAFSTACQVPTVLAALRDQKSGSEALAAAITTKVPADLQTLASTLSADIAANLQRGIDAYTSASNAPTCTSSTAAPPPGSSTAAPPPGSSTAAPPPGSSTAAPPPGSSSSSSSSSAAPAPPPTYPSDTLDLPPPSSPTVKPPTSPSKPATPPTYPTNNPPPPPPPAYPTKPAPTSQKPSTTARTPPPVYTGAANQVGASFALVAGLAALFV